MTDSATRALSSIEGLEQHTGPKRAALAMKSRGIVTPNQRTITTLHLGAHKGGVFEGLRLAHEIVGRTLASSVRPHRTAAASAGSRQPDTSP